MANSIKDLKVGDPIFVVQQRRRGDTEDRTSREVVSRVGTKYAYWSERHSEYPFHRDTGISAHSRDCNARANGYGFDVYICEDDWLAKVHAEKEYARLRERLCDHWRTLKPLSHEVVADIHKVLDKWAEDINDVG